VVTNICAGCNKIERGETWASPYLCEDCKNEGADRLVPVSVSVPANVRVADVGNEAKATSRVPAGGSLFLFEC
jgi:hypothetical protein